MTQVRIVKRGPRAPRAEQFICPDCKERKSTQRWHGAPMRCANCAWLHKLKLNRILKERKREQRAEKRALIPPVKPHDPYSLAVRRIAKLTGHPASEWEYKLNHPYVKLANRAALELFNRYQQTGVAA